MKPKTNLEYCYGCNRKTKRVRTKEGSYCPFCKKEAIKQRKSLRS